MPATTAETLSLVTRSVSVAPLVLLSVVDHYNRTEANTSRSKRVVGVLLGQNEGNNVRVSNSFAGTQSHPLGRAVSLMQTQSPLRRMTRTRRSGSSTTTTSSR